MKIHIFETNYCRMKKLILKGFPCLVLLLFCFSSFANNIRVKKLSLSDTVFTSKNVNIKFDLSWENSWRDDINWDAAWITVKVKRANGSWKHVKFQSSGNTIEGNTSNAKIVVPEDKMGAFIYRSAKGTGNVDLTGIKLAWNYGLDSVSRIDTVEIRLFATEMVYVPQGSFAFGDSYTPSSGMYYPTYPDRIIPSIFKNFVAADTIKFGRNTPMFSIISDKNTPKLSSATSNNNIAGSSSDQVISDGIYINGLKGIGTDPDQPFKYPNFPVGYNAYYCMKYEVTQGQYTDFLNTTKISTVTQTGFPMPGMGTSLLPQPGSPNQPLARFSIEKQGESYTVSRPDRAMDYVNGTQLFAFANWSSLRPMTELEFEKAARGPLAPSAGDRAHGLPPTYISPSDYLNKTITVLKLNTAENGTEVPVGVDSTKFLNGIMNVEGGDGGTGPYRVGVFATNSSSRISSGASYYGIMGLSDNTGEFVISLSSEVSRSYKDANGIGENSPLGFPTLSHWINGTYMDIYSLMLYKRDVISSRNSSWGTGGFRLVRSAPSDN